MAEYYEHSFCKKWHCLLFMRIRRKVNRFATDAGQLTHHTSSMKEQLEAAGFHGCAEVASGKPDQTDFQQTVHVGVSDGQITVFAPAAEKAAKKTTLFSMGQAAGQFKPNPACCFASSLLQHRVLGSVCNLGIDPFKNLL